MADFTDQDKELLDKLRKGFERDAKTRSQLEPWEELLDRDATVNANRAAAAAKIVEGFAGSWAAQYKYGLGSSVNPTGSLVGEPVAGFDPQGPPVPIRSKINKLGQRGMPEINFVPYNWRTNTFGSKGPSLVGHPIGFEIVGPTLKSPYMDWTWRVELGTGVGGGDVLVMDVRPDGNPNVVSPYSGNFTDAYGPFAGVGWTIGDDTEPNGGIYIVIADDGNNPGSLPAGRLPMPALDLYADTARFEVFRVAQIPLIDAGIPFRIHLHPSKRLSQFFDVSNAPDLSIRAITMLKPYVTRLAAIPQSGASGGSSGASVSGREQTFVVVSPERAATGDNFPPFNGRTTGDGTWVQGGFTDSRGAFGFPIGGELTAYGGKNRLPIPNPLREETARVDSAFGAPTTLVGQWAGEVGSLTPYTTGPFASYLPIAHITVTQRDDDLPGLSLGTLPSCLGWFDIVGTDAGPDRILMNRVPETDPTTGLTYWGPGPFVNNTLGSREVTMFMTLHQPIEALWQGSFDVDKTESSRLKNLIDPQWVERFEKQLSDPLLVGGVAAPPPGSGPGRPDRAIFNTRRYPSMAGPIPDIDDPGSLMDLGFRMVLFPAKEDPNDATKTIPDFDRPITGRELVIDGSIDEKQYVEVDYSSGVVRLSHPPPQSRSTTPLAPSDVIPNGISGTTGVGANNPRGEVVLFAACVPYSMEDSQVGTGNRVTASEGAGKRDFDLYSDEISAHIDLTNTTFTGTAPYIGVSGLTGAVDIVLDRLVPEAPETGVFTITRGTDNSQPLSRWGYTEKKTVTLGTYQVTALGGISSLPGVINPDPGVSGETRYVVIRRDAVFSRESFSIPALSDAVGGDTYYGSSARAETLRFERSRLVPQLDGSISVRPRPDLGAQLDRATGHILPAKRRDPTDTTINPGPSSDLYPYEGGIYHGLSYQTVPGDPRGTNPGMNYNTGVSVTNAADYNLGPAMITQLVGTPPIYYGFITTETPAFPGVGSFLLASNFRWVAKVALSFRNAATQTTAFVGFIQDTSGPGLTPVVSTLSDPALAPPVHYYAGFQLDTSGTPEWRAWTRGSAGDNIIGLGAAYDPSSAFVQGPYYLVMESPRITLASDDSVVVKFGIYDGNKRLLGSTNVTRRSLLPNAAGRGLFTALALRENAVPSGGLDIIFYGMSVVLDTGIDDLPPLP
jgi:hypothetical protein